MFHLAIFLRLRLMNNTIRYAIHHSITPEPSSNFLLRDIFLPDRASTAMKVISSPSDRQATILTLKSIHHDLMRCVRMVNIVFGFQTMLCIGITFLFTLFTLFATYKTYFYNEIDYRVTLSSLYWCFFYNYFKASVAFNTIIYIGYNFNAVIGVHHFYFPPSRC